MTASDFHPDERRLWDRARAGAPDGFPDVDALEIAAWLDGRLDEAAAADLEARLARSPEARAAATDARAALDRLAEARPLVPAHVLDAGRDLLPEPALVHSARPWSGRGGVLRLALSSAAAIAICVLGYQAGLTASAPADAGEAALASEMTFGAFDDSVLDDPDLDLFALATEVEG